MTAIRSLMLGAAGHGLELVAVAAVAGQRLNLVGRVLDQLLAPTLAPGTKLVESRGPTAQDALAEGAQIALFAQLTHLESTLSHVEHAVADSNHGLATDLGAEAEAGSTIATLSPLIPGVGQNQIPGLADVLSQSDDQSLAGSTSGLRLLAHGAELDRTVENACPRLLPAGADVEQCHLREHLVVVDVASRRPPEELTALDVLAILLVEEQLLAEQPVEERAETAEGSVGDSDPTRLSERGPEELTRSQHLLVRSTAVNRRVGGHGRDGARERQEGVGHLDLVTHTPRADRDLASRTHGSGVDLRPVAGTHGLIATLALPALRSALAERQSADTRHRQPVSACERQHRAEHLVAQSVGRLYSSDRRGIPLDQRVAGIPAQPPENRMTGSYQLVSEDVVVDSFVALHPADTLDDGVGLAGKAGRLNELELLLKPQRQSLSQCNTWDVGEEFSESVANPLVIVSMSLRGQLPSRLPLLRGGCLAKPAWTSCPYRPGQSCPCLLMH